MAERPVITNLVEALRARRFPTITLWNRLEGRPRRADFDRALKAEVRDPLWMLCRQWQMGEFQGDDAGSPSAAKVHMTTTRLTKYAPARGEARPFPDDLPIEAVVEQRPVPFAAGDQPLALDLRLVMGRRWLKLVRRAIGDFDQAFIDRFPIALPDPDAAADAATVAHGDAWAQVAAAAGRAMDGHALYRHVTADPGNHAHDGVAIPPAHHAAIDGLAARFVAWFDALFLQPEDGGGDAWIPERLEYRFACAAPAAGGEKVYTADEYFHGRLDWYNLDVDPKAASLELPGGPAIPDPRARAVASFIPVELVFNGMPATRWWAFEDRKTNLGDIAPAKTDLSKMLYLEFGLVYANDWFVIPHALAAGSIAQVTGLAVTNVFGERTWIEAAGRGQDDDWQRWSMFNVNVRGKTADPADTSLVLLPTVPKVQEGPPLEEVALVRDEMANMVWAIETRVPTRAGTTLPGREAARELRAVHRRLLAQALESGAAVEPADTPTAPVRYRIMSEVPENWIPFVPVRVPGDNRQIQLQRAALPRVLEGDPNPAVKIRPRTTLLREGLDRTPRAAYHVPEEEVPRAGVVVSQSFQRTRWYGGKVVTWVGVRKRTGRGESSSGLAFDRLVPTRRR